MTRNEIFRATFGDLARPFAIWASASAAAVSTVRLAWVTQDLSGAAVYMTAIWAGVGALYLGKSWERNTEAKQNAQIEMAKTMPSAPAPGTANVQAAPDVTVTVSETGEHETDGELPPEYRVRP